MTHSPRDTETLFVTDDELVRRLGVPEKVAAPIIHERDNKPSGFPKKQDLWGGRRYWPAVLAYFERVYGVQPQIGAARVAPESPGRNGPPRRNLAAPLRKVEFP